jgi:radical SAM protein with 4Fe4S-binding SPASM domain
MDRASGVMDPGLFTRIVDEVGENIFIMMLWDWGEPFVNPGIHDMIACAKKRNIKILASTNGHFFRTGEEAMKVVRSGLDALVIAVDGISQETYQRYRGQGSLETVIEGIRTLVSAKKKLNSKTPLINFRFVVMNHNEHEVPKLREFAQVLEVDMLSLRSLHPHDAEGLLKGSPDGSRYQPENPRYQRFKTESDGITPMRRAINPCRKLWNSTTVHWNGTVCPCCFDPHDRYSLGDLKMNRFRKIWRGPLYRNMRREFRRDYRSIKVCSDCTYAFEGGALSTEDFIETHFFETEQGRKTAMK